MSRRARAARTTMLLMGLNVGAARALSAQESSAAVGTATLTVRVQDARTMTALPDILVALDGPRGGIVRTDRRGRARFVDRPLGLYALRIAATGFAIAEEKIELTISGAVDMSLNLEPRGSTPQMLPEVLTTATRSSVPGFDARRIRNRANSFDRASIDSLAPRVTSDLLRRIPSVRLVASGGGFVPRTRRAGVAGDCPMSIYLDGVQIDDERGEPPAPPMGQSARSARASPPSVVDGIAIDLLDAVEVFIGASEIPAQFNQRGGSCGVVALWTRARR